MRTPPPPAVLLDRVLEALALAVDRERAVTELAGWLAEPWTRHLADPSGHCSSLTESGAPFELSVKLAGTGGRPSVRYVVDVADPRSDLRANADTYRRTAEQATGQPADVLGRLFRIHLADAPPGTLANVMIGVGWADGDRRRSTLYLPAGWLTPAELDDRLPEPTGLAEPAQVVGYDFSDRALDCWKTYHWYPVGGPVDRGAGEHLSPYAMEVRDRFAGRVAPQARERTTFRQRRFGPARVDDKLFLFTRGWDLIEPTAFRALLGCLGGMGLDLAPLRTVAALSREVGLPLHVGLVAVGGVDGPSATFYFWPRTG
ncbi:MAG TPA: hypothetical protein VIT65_03400 [Microlunatus sp.]